MTSLVGVAASGRAPSRRARLVVALLAGVVAALWCWQQLRTAAPDAAGDFTYLWRAARILADGGNPYATIVPSGAYPYQGHFLYPLPAAVLVLPLAALPLHAAALLFAGASAGLLAWALTRDGWARLPALASVPVVWASSFGQGVPLVVAAALLTPAAGILVCKPNIGAAAGVYRLTRDADGRRFLLWGIAGAAVLLGVSFACLPTWPAAWLGAVAAEPMPERYSVPLRATPAASVVLLALLRWRRPEARLLAALVCVPQNYLFYELLPLWLIPRTARESWGLTLASYVAVAVGAWAGHVRAVGIACLYLPCLLLVLGRPNVAAGGDAGAAWLERWAHRLRAGHAVPTRPERP